MKTLVTGGTGFTGKALVKRLLDLGHEVVALDYKEGLKTQELRDWGAEVVLGSVTDSLIADGYTDGGGRAIQLGSSTLATLRTRVRGMLIRNNTGFSVAEGTGSDSNLIEGNLIRNGGVSKVGASTKVRRNDGVYVTENQGVATIASGGTSITVNHGLNVTPVVVMLTGRGPETADAYVNTISSSQFQIMVPAAVTAARDVMWEARA